MNYALLCRVTLPELALELAALLALAVDLGPLRRATEKRRLAASVGIGVAGCLAAMGALSLRGGLDLSWNGDVRLGALLAVTGLTPAAQMGILALTALALLLLPGTNFTRHKGEYVALTLMTASGGLVVAAARDLLTLFLGLELMSLGLYVLTAFAKSRRDSAEAALKYYLFGGVSTAFLLFGMSYLYGLTGQTNLTALYAALASAPGPHAPLLYVAMAFVAAGIGFKAAAAPFHFWIADVYEGASAPTAAFLASVSKVALFGLLTALASAPVALSIAGEAGRGARASAVLLALLLAGLSMLLGNLAALAQTNVRRLLAYSAIAHSGYMLLGVGALITGGAGQGRLSVALLFYALTYALATLGFFGVASVVERASGSETLDGYLGLWRRNPLLAVLLLVFAFSLAGLPPLVGFWAKFALFAAVLGVAGGPLFFALVALGVLLSVVSFYYYLQPLRRAWVLPAVDPEPVTASPVVLAALVLAAFLVLLLGCAPDLLQHGLESLLPLAR